MPDDLSGELSENKWLISRFVADLPPHHHFWRELTQLVNLAFPKDSLCESGSLERKVHQFRYVISSQQAEYVRKFYRKAGQTDVQALAAYLAERRIFSYYLNEPARFHNKLAISNGKKIYPGGKESYNIKILISCFHTEFILSSNGNFLNEVDAEKVTEAGIVNGASFNYGNLGRHWALDVKPVGPHDPPFRKQLTKKYRSPKNSRKRFGRQFAEDYAFSYFNRNGIYAQDGISHFEKVKRESRQLKRHIKAFGYESPNAPWPVNGLRSVKNNLARISKGVFSGKKKG